jgi:hypothetical protein
MSATYENALQQVKGELEMLKLRETAVFEAIKRMETALEEYQRQKISISGELSRLHRLRDSLEVAVRSSEP